MAIVNFTIYNNYAFSESVVNLCERTLVYFIAHVVPVCPNVGLFY